MCLVFNYTCILNTFQCGNLECGNHLTNTLNSILAHVSSFKKKRYLLIRRRKNYTFLPLSGTFRWKWLQTRWRTSAVNGESRDLSSWSCVVQRASPTIHPVTDCCETLTLKQSNIETRGAGGSSSGEVATGRSLVRGSRCPWARCHLTPAAPVDCTRAVN